MRQQQHIQQIFHMGLLLQGFHEKRVPFLVRRLGGIVPLPAEQQIVLVGQYPETVALHALELLLQDFLLLPVLRAASAGWLLILVRDGEVLHQHEGGFLWADVFQPRSEVNHMARKPKKSREPVKDFLLSGDSVCQYSVSFGLPLCKKFLIQPLSIAVCHSANIICNHKNP